MALIKDFFPMPIAVTASARNHEATWLNVISMGAYIYTYTYTCIGHIQLAICIHRFCSYGFHQPWIKNIENRTRKVYTKCMQTFILVTVP